ncbi:hypothetical protein AYM40_04765 [Paraburkholderia phytofirmans OLGA172]|uniref:Uncharacterized protein n=1 Tax=Paraburkholderia phytofirmans OLGA172 TaxID=1417228 RepID=A0A160FHV7_9BURK|nr:hypothetical protein [Paraburkholderia phytofirmans]ANB71761.1 hypothetical protein AYM40_04765 [Paraburkholderia phytofirmans OLGA172]
MDEKKSPDREGLGEAIGSPTAEVSIRNWPATGRYLDSGPVLGMGRAEVLRAQRTMLGYRMGRRRLANLTV